MFISVGFGMAPSPSGGRRGWGPRACASATGPHPCPPPEGEGEKYHAVCFWRFSPALASSASTSSACALAAIGKPRRARLSR
ncbi:hypothetical protein FOZ74_09345 [Comamonas flocculans]|uniref:Uncharacterized protein n=1 Tax=Comamonas flocculans TaxID=2597701 RepID=A0A5B8RYC4_9BURK|nr:hypothetical protein FOZ74_09345 [Comamonas flocculans]